MTIEDALAAIGLEGCRYVREDSGGPGEYPEFKVYAPRSQVKAARRKWLGISIPTNFALSINQETPPLVPAKVGDFVLIYSDYVIDDDESPVGVVVSELVVEGVTVYGCSYIEPSLGDPHKSDVYDFHLSTADYGLHQRGFLKILTAHELKVHLTKRIDDGYADAIATLNRRREHALHNLDGLVESLGKGQSITTTMWRLHTDDHPASTCVNLPQIHVPNH